jgi:hypothetical protein
MPVLEPSHRGLGQEERTVSAPQETTPEGLDAALLARLAKVVPRESPVAPPIRPSSLPPRFFEFE